MKLARSPVVSPSSERATRIKTPLGIRPRMGVNVSFSSSAVISGPRNRIRSLTACYKVLDTHFHRVGRSHVQIAAGLLNSQWKAVPGTSPKALLARIVQLKCVQASLNWPDEQRIATSQNAENSVLSPHGSPCRSPVDSVCCRKTRVVPRCQRDWGDEPVFPEHAGHAMSTGGSVRNEDFVVFGAEPQNNCGTAVSETAELFHHNRLRERRIRS